jgi:hypothetical protein
MRLGTMLSDLRPREGRSALKCVIVSIKTESWMHFRARLDNGTLEVRLERAVRI